jgi:hypothetical protein
MDQSRPFLHIVAINKDAQKLTLGVRKGTFTVELEWFQFEVRPDVEAVYTYSESNLVGWIELSEYLWDFDAIQARRDKEYKDFVRLRQNFTWARQHNEDVKLLQNKLEDAKRVVSECTQNVAKQIAQKHADAIETQLQTLMSTNPWDAFKRAIKELCFCEHMWRRVYQRQLAARQLSKHDEGLTSVWSEQSQLAYTLQNYLPPLEQALSLVH